jgi:hypothetical protein
MNLVEQLEALVAEAKTNGIGFYLKGNKSAGTRLRKNAQDIKNIAQEIRKDVSEKKNG